MVDSHQGTFKLSSPSFQIPFLLVNYNILTAHLDQCVLHGTSLTEAFTDFGRTDCSQTVVCAGDFDSDGDVDGLDLLPLSSCK